MRPAPAAARTITSLALAVAVLAGCTSTEDAAPSPAPTTTTPATTPAPTTTTVAPTTPAPVELPPVPAAQVAGDCPYLAADDVAAFNGERVSGVQLDPTYDPPACFFAQNNGDQQLSVWVWTAASPEAATAAVDRAAPVETTDPADQPAGWLGGSSGGTEGAVYAVAKGTVAVVVTTNQQQSVKARRVAEQVISSLAL